MATIGSRIRSLREFHSWSQEDLAQRSGLGRAHISLMENNERAPAADTLIKLAPALNTTTDYLLGLTDDPTAPPSPDALSAIERAARDPFFQQIAFCWPALTYKDREAIAYTTNKFKIKRQRESQE